MLQKEFANATLMIRGPPGAHLPSRVSLDHILKFEVLQPLRLLQARIEVSTNQLLCLFLNLGIMEVGRREIVNWGLGRSEWETQVKKLKPATWLKMFPTFS